MIKRASRPFVPARLVTIATKPVFHPTNKEEGDVVVGSTYLHPDLRQVDLHGQLLTAVHVRVVGLLEGPLQLVELVGGEGGAVAPVLLLGLVVLAEVGGLGVAVLVAVHAAPQLAGVPVALGAQHDHVCSGHSWENHGKDVRRELGRGEGGVGCM